MSDDEQGDPRGNLAQKLQYLRWTRRGLGNRMLSFEEIAEGVTRSTGRRCGAPYIEKLFTGKPVRHPDQERLAAILTLFGKTLDDLTDQGDPDGTFGQRLQYLRYQYGQERLNGKLPTFEQIAEHVRTYTGRSCRAEYIGQLINDREPSGLAKDKIEALAAYFDVSPAFFFDDEQSRAFLDQKAFIDALYELQEVGGHVEAAFRHGRPVDPADLPKLTEIIRAQIAASREQRAGPREGEAGGR